MRRVIVPCVRLTTAAMLARCTTRYCSDSSSSNKTTTTTTTATTTATAAQATTTDASPQQHAAPRLYTDSHEWVQASNEDVRAVTVGMSKYAQQILGDIVYVSLPAVGSRVEAQGVLAEVESVKATSVVYAPVSGTISAVNEQLRDMPSLLNTAPEGDGWIAKLSDASLPEQLMTEEQYNKFLE